MITRRDFIKAGAVILTGSQAAESAAHNEELAYGSKESPATPQEEKSGSRWTARWIWPSVNGLEPNYFVYFRRTFNLNAVPTEEVFVKVSARTEYILYVNGHKIGFGPPIADARRYYFDLRNIQPYLRQGSNVMAARVYSLATATEDTLKVPGGFILQGRIGEVRLDSDSTWKFLVPEVWKQNAPRQSFQLHYVEIADFRKEPAGWNGPGFDDSGWKRALEMSGPESTQNLVRRELGDFSEAFMPVASVVRSAEVARNSAFEIPAFQVNAEKFLPVQTVKFQDLASLGGKRPAARVETPASGRDAALVFDMGKMVLGCPFFEVEGSAGTVVDVSISEYLEDGRVLASREITPKERTNLTDRITLRQGKTVWQRNDYNGYRYIQLTVRKARKPVVLRRVGTMLRNYGFQHEAVFRSSNSALDRIFDAAKWSHRVNTHWGYCGSSWREHAQWSDLPWPATNLMVFHDAPLLRYYLRQITLGQNSEGRMQFPYPGSIGGELPEQTMWLAEVLWKCALHFDDRDLVRDLLPVMVKANDWFRKHMTPRGLLSTKDWRHIWLVIDWGYPYVNDPEPGELATLNLIYYSFLRSVEKCAEYDGNEEIRESFSHQADTLKKTINEIFWAPEQGIYYEKPGPLAPSQYASILAVRHCVAPPDRLQEIFDFAVGSELRPGKASPWFMYSTLEAFARAGRFEEAVRSICRYWGSFLDADATTFWELWNIPGEDIHPIRGYTREMGSRTITYSSAPGPYTISHILGVQPLKPGFSEMLIAPHSSGLDSFEGTAPTPRGDVHVKSERQKSENQTDFYVTVPEAAKITLRVPYSRRQPIVTVNNQAWFSGGRFQPNPLIANPRAADDYLELEVAPGNYYFRASASKQKSEL
ncbi:MAG TPA: family 78 glycoside hydrolase catalytic domain [Terriglobia bacterium]|nr:family 78 glycoside hydrolase catalytic domain [Terriglobia bacterium]